MLPSGFIPTLSSIIAFDLIKTFFNLKALGNRQTVYYGDNSKIKQTTVN